MHGGLNIKGTALLPIASILRAERAKIEPMLAPHLLHYIDDDVRVANWYPIEDVLGLLRVLAVYLMPELPSQRTFELFGAVCAERDLQGKQDLMREEHRVTAGFLEGAISKRHDLVTSVRRACGLHQLYYDAGEITVRRTGPRTLRLRNEGQPFVAEELCHLTRGFFRHVFRILGLQAQLETVSCRGRGDAECEWDMLLPADVDVSKLSAFER